MPASENTLIQNLVNLISPMTEHDLLEVVEIEQSSGLSPWGWEAYHRELQSNDRGLMWVARLDPQTNSGNALAGYVVGRLAADELHINNIAVRDQYRRGGLATALLNRVLAAAKRYKANKAFLEVRAGNSAAQALYEKCGFTAVGRRRNYYSNPPEDALIMMAEVGESA
ncbi:MAG TPA: ribosomal protein S18-alanine N-acetyltransferase [Pyrinomonadaceae bacterium]|jgi:ribosomal-protein-alanine N-acetyltransferase|nr:ribosomal protein S18-alanine N-acetyltransferase [Pyrinomonadaceae bacterium]